MHHSGKLAKLLVKAVWAMLLSHSVQTRHTTHCNISAVWYCVPGLQRCRCVAAGLQERVLVCQAKGCWLNQGGPVFGFQVFAIVLVAWTERI